MAIGGNKIPDADGAALPNCVVYNWNIVAAYYLIKILRYHTFVMPHPAAKLTKTDFN